MNLLTIGCNFRTAPIEVRERLAFDEAKETKALEEINRLFSLDAVVLSTCNRVELYVASAGEAAPPRSEALISFLEEFHALNSGSLQKDLYQYRQIDAVRHLFRVASSLDSLVVGEGQIAGQVRTAYQLAQRARSVGPAMHALFQHAQRVAGRVRTETGIARGRVSVSSLAVDYVRQVFEHFTDKTVLVIGAGKMGELTLRHLRRLNPRRILITNRSPEKAQSLAREWDGQPIPWEALDDTLAQADIVLSSTGAPDLVVTRDRFERIRARRTAGPMVILDIAVPRDFEPAIHDGDQTCLFNIDDLKQIRERTLHERQMHVRPAEEIVEQEVRRFQKEWNRRRHGAIIARLTDDLEAKRQAIVAQLLSRLNGRLSDDDRAYIEGAFRLLQNQFLHGPITALTDEPAETSRHTLLEALRKLFRLQD